MLNAYRRVTIRDSFDDSGRADASTVRSATSTHLRRISVPAETRIVLTGENAAPETFDPEQDFLNALGG